MGHKLIERERESYLKQKKEIMKILFWNIKGLGSSGRCNQLRELRYKHRVDVICLQETIKHDFTGWELNSLSEGTFLNGVGLQQLATQVSL
jgi:endonuclease/exonuclease/phosphatase family metal-dependent hydrolase